ncbi:cupin domain-containing protein [Herbaspirillum seropedicae]|uniref:cupin domain-containing protein n=1 Tax=Herbaspirillum seropedicae TaxID=964 RepID=UPI003FCD1EE0
MTFLTSTLDRSTTALTIKLIEEPIVCIDFGMSRKSFSVDYQEKKPLLIRNAVRHIDFGWTDVCEILERCHVDDPSFKLSYNGAILPKKDYVERYLDVGTPSYRLIKPAVYDYMRKGATLIANRIKHEPKVSAFARAVGEFTGRQVVSSAYAAFGEKSSFRSHWDTRDVFAIQLIGRKRWLIYEPTFEFPLSTQQSKDYEVKFPHSKEPYLDIVLEPGDVLYVPRGWWHDPLPLGEGCFHLALGTFSPYVADYLRWAVHQMQEIVVARRSLDAWESDQALLEKATQQLVDFIRSSENYTQFMDEYYSHVRDEAPLDLGNLADREGGDLPDHASLRLRAYRPRGLDQAYLMHDGRKITLEPHVAEVLSMVSESPGIRLNKVLESSAFEDKTLLRQIVKDLCQQDILC